MRFGVTSGRIAVDTASGGASQSRLGLPAWIESIADFQIRAGYIAPCTRVIPSLLTNSGMFTIGV